MKITKDNFVWKLVNNQAKELFSTGIFEIFALYGDDSESLIETSTQLNEALEQGLDIGIEVGFLEK